MNNIINTVSSIIQGKDKYYNIAIFLIILQCTVNVISISMTYIQQFLTTKIEFQLDHFVDKKINLKLDNLSYEHFEYPDFYNRFNRVVKNGSIASNLLSPVKSLIEIIGGIISLISIIILLFNIHWILVLLSIISFLPFLIFNSRFGKEDYKLIKYQTLDKRKSNYYKALLHDKQSIKEIRLFNLTKYFTNKWENLYLKNMRESIHLASKQTKHRIFLETFKYCVYGVASLFVIRLISKEKAKIGDFVMIVQAIQQVQSMSTVIASSISKIYSNLFYINDYFELMDLIEKADEHANLTDGEDITNIYSIEFVNVTFKYPNSSQTILKGINLHIRAGEKIAIVGENGSGKTTLILCLLGFYRLTNGYIKINNKVIEQYNLESLRKRFTVIFQDFMRYAFTIRENIEIGDIDYIGNQKKFYDASRVSGVDDFVKSLERGYDTHLSKFFEEGIDLSGGQWQKIAIARTVYRNTDVLILDEPTSSLDPRSEYEIYKQFDKLSSDKITINISHRLAYIKNVDMIYVLDKGTIVEKGTHNELLSKNGIYSEMYNNQSRIMLNDNSNVQVQSMFV